MLTNKELLQLALAALETAEIDGNCEYGATEVLRKALAQPEPEPVAIVQQEAYGRGQVLWVQPASTVPDGTPLYTAPPEHKQLFKNVHSVNRNRDMSITLVFKSCASASEFFKEANIKENNK